MKLDVQARVDEMERQTAKCNRKKQDAYKRAAANRNASEADLVLAKREMNQTASILAQASKDVEASNKTTTAFVKTKTRRIAQLEELVATTQSQMALIEHVIAVVKQMNKTWHENNEDKHVDIKPVMNMLYGVVRNIQVDIDTVQTNIKKRDLDISNAKRAHEAEKVAFKKAQQRYDNTSANLENRTAQLNQAIKDATSRLQAIGLERSDCVQEVTADARTHEESMRVIDFIVAYFEKLLGVEGVVDGGNGNSTNETFIGSPNATAEEAEVAENDNVTMGSLSRKNRTAVEEGAKDDAIDANSGTETSADKQPDEPEPKVEANATSELVSNSSRSNAEMMRAVLRAAKSSLKEKEDKVAQKTAVEEDVEVDPSPIGSVIAEKPAKRVSAEGESAKTADRAENGHWAQLFH